jgi:hypothetical protein
MEGPFVRSVISEITSGWRLLVDPSSFFTVVWHDHRQSTER